MSVNTVDRPFGEGGGAVGGEGKRSWAQLLGSSLPSSLNKNVLEVLLEKDVRGAFVVSENDCARLMRKIGLDERPGVHVEAVQICPNGRGVIFITLKENVKIENFCRYDVLVVTDSGIQTSLVKPAGRREVVISMKGIHPNTRDNVVLDYLAKFGKIVTTKVVHGVFRDGPLKGIKNGDRSFKMEVKPGENIGSYHFIDGQKISLRYAGQQQTCGRCHETPQKCRGRGIAKKCEEEGGRRIEFSEYILGLWKKIGYSPSNEEVARKVNEEDEIEDVQIGSVFTPVKVPSCDVEKYAGVSIRQFPRDTDQGEIVEFLCKEGLPDDKKEDISFQAKGVVTISNLDNATSKQLIEAIHGKFNFGKRLYCNGVIPLTPDKKDSEETIKTPTTAASSAPLSQVPLAPTSTGLPLVISPIDPSPQSLKQFKISDHILLLKDPAVVSNQSRTSALVRRHSLCLMNRSPPRNSLAAELLETNSPRHGLLKTKSMLKDIVDQLSEFGSAQSELSSSSSDESGVENSENGGFKTMNEKKRNRKMKRKLKLTPGKEEFMKKPNLSNSN